MSSNERIARPHGVFAWLYGLLCALSLLGGAAVYVFLRGQALLFVPAYGHSSYWPPWVRYQLPDALWAMSMAWGLLAIQPARVWQAGLTALALSLAYEYNRGTYDGYDVLAYMAGISLVMTIHYMLLTNQFKPLKKMRMMKRMKENAKAVASVLLLSVFVFFAVASEDEESKDTEKAKEENRVVEAGDVMKTDYFEITVNEVNISDRVSTGNQFVEIEPEEGNMFLIFAISMKNIDDESRTMVGEGEVIIHSGGKDYVYEKSETVMLEGWGIFLDKVNPLTTINTRLVFKIPKEITGEIYWKPERDSKDQLFYLGKYEGEPDK